jgi:transposase-like protein
MPGLSKDSVNSVILAAGAYTEAVMSNLLKNLRLNECQMDELWSFVNKKTLDEEGLAKGHGTKWIWTAFSPDNRLIVCYLIGDRTLGNCSAYFKKSLSYVSNKPLFTSDELVHCKIVLRDFF